MYGSLTKHFRRKYFSSVERLRIAQESAAHSQKKTIATRIHSLSSRASADALRPMTSHSVRSPSLRFSPSKEILAARHSRSDVDVDEHQALRFLALPSKVKRTHFTREELILLTESSERVLGWTALHNRSRRTGQDLHGSVGSSRHFSVASDDSINDMEKDWFEAKTASLHSIEQADVEVPVTMQDEAAAAPTINFSRSRSAPLAIQRPATRYNKSTTRRRMSILAPLPLPPPTLLPAVPALPSPTHLKVTSPATETKYYKDSDARSKLREFLTSPDKFDEALEFGFPQRRTTSSTSSDQPSLPSELDELSVSHTQDEYEDEDDEDDYLCDPRTPSMSTDSYSPGIFHHGSIDSGVAMPYQFAAHRKESILSLSSPDFDRSMTMKMTLTRSDLRAPEDKLYSMARMAASGVDLAEDPLALDPLPVCEDHSGLQGAFAVASRRSSSGGGLKKVWKNLRKI